MNTPKINVAKQAVKLIEKKITPETIIGIGTGSTVNFFIDELKKYKNLFKGAVSSSNASTKLLNDSGIQTYNLNEVLEIEFYIDGADEVSKDNYLIKGGGGAHTREKIVASAANYFICIVDSSKLVNQLGAFPLPIEVIPESRSLVSRKIVSMGGIPLYRSGFLTDQGNEIIDVKNLDISDPMNLEMELNNIPGVVENGIFAVNKPSEILVGK
ncbi:MAG: ribose 5-phosphate isomerase A [Gammaproteobacteria bacterium TMED278]|jgi:ribose 5-phosphate isomerase A|nr:ribose 5-phosphate isomerase A [Gammaproteobacteria bacterium]OUX41530.1 MAG: ribose 5-phosphate isomerase A [Gammaproteobacteria bacterium TMED278]RCL36253.1 MAG: ribose-5-phosphate isomerase RpiA [SAR86 cluster bacterium]URQ69643.1 ribose-5-phosphate isomerase RpiA [SAR86 cluster bacterium]|tara:strand:+ start:2725 stop:3363 length:639 start_codon:yes stop_codon:yes gene_type:complete